MRTVKNNQGLISALDTLTPQMMDAYAITGNPDQIIAKIQAFIDAGVQHIIFLLLTDHKRMLKQLGTKILPHFR